jgi:gas vesicle protein
MKLNKNDKLKKLHKTIDKIVKSRQIQKAKVDLNVMKEELTQEELKKFHKPMVDKLTSIIDTTNFKKRSLLPIEDSLSTPLPIAGPSTTLIPIEHTSKESSKTVKDSSKSVKESLKTVKESLKSPKESFKESIQNLETTFKNVFYPDEGIDEEIVKNYYRFNMPSEIVKDKNLYEPNYKRVVQQLKSLGGRKKSKDAGSDIDKDIEALSFYNERIKLIKKGLDQQSTVQTGSGIINYKYYSSCDELIQRLNLLCGITEAGNNSPEVRNEIVSILDILLKNRNINSKEHKKLYNKWCY